MPSLQSPGQQCRAGSSALGTRSFALMWAHWAASKPAAGGHQRSGEKRRLTLTILSKRNEENNARPVVTFRVCLGNAKGAQLKMQCSAGNTQEEFNFSTINGSGKQNQDQNLTTMNSTTLDLNSLTNPWTINKLFSDLN